MNLECQGIHFTDGRRSRCNLIHCQHSFQRYSVTDSFTSLLLPPLSPLTHAFQTIKSTVIHMPVAPDTLNHELLSRLPSESSNILTTLYLRCFAQLLSSSVTSLPTSTSTMPPLASVCLP